jgi:hypothetical protein
MLRVVTFSQLSISYFVVGVLFLNIYWCMIGFLRGKIFNARAREKQY